ncbi:hypothetical protein ACIBCA_27900 [Kitasatospora sp. NPDC051170]|uniref:hypothetical protein n=1 Tax=Kitasatospora sp. NPDC051170 TaxID=3364056 RepID=UPI0037970C69
MWLLAWLILRLSPERRRVIAEEHYLREVCREATWEAFRAELAHEADRLERAMVSRRRPRSTRPPNRLG